MAKTQTPATVEATIVVPLGNSAHEDSYERQKINRGVVQIQAKLGTVAAENFIRIRNGLREQNYVLSNGRPIRTNSDALRWMLENIFD